MNQPPLPEIPPKPKRSIRCRKQPLREQLALAADALIRANGLILECVVALRETTGLETELDAAHAENVRLRDELTAARAPKSWIESLWASWFPRLTRRKQA